MECPIINLCVLNRNRFTDHFVRGLDIFPVSSVLAILKHVSERQPLDIRAASYTFWINALQLILRQLSKNIILKRLCSFLKKVYALRGSHTGIKTVIE